MNMKISIDGGVTWQEAKEDVRIIYSDLLGEVDDKEQEVQLQLVHTYEGIIADVLTKDGEMTGITSSQTAQELVEELINR